MSEKIHQSMRLLVRDLDALKRLYGTKTAGMQQAIDGFIPLRQYTLREIQGTFTKSELIALTDFLRRMPIEDPLLRINKEALITLLLDNSELHDLSISHEIVYDDLIYKLNKLTAAQVYFLQSEIARYWKVNKGKRYNIDQFIETMI